MAKYTEEELDRVIDKAAERAVSKISDRAINEAAERGADAYYEKTKDDIALVLEATDSIQDKLKSMVTRDEFSELKGEVKIIRLAVADTNKDLSQFNKPGWFPGKRY